MLEIEQWCSLLIGGNFFFEWSHLDQTLAEFTIFDAAVMMTWVLLC